MKDTLTGKGKAVVKYFLLNGNTPAYQKRIAKNAGISEQYLGTGGFLAKLKEEGILDLIVSKVRQRGITNHYFLKEDPATFQKIAYEFLKDKDIALIFTHSKYTEKMMDYVIKEHKSLYEDNEAFEELKKMLKLSPKMFELCLTVDNLGRKYLQRSNEIDYYGISEIAFEKRYPPSGEENSDWDASVKHYVRWELFRACLKTDTSFLEGEENPLPDEILEMLKIESVKRTIADATFVLDSISNQRFDYELSKRDEALIKAASDKMFDGIMKTLKNEENEEERKS